MIIPLILNADPGSWRVTCLTCSEQIVLENMATHEMALDAISADGWSRIGDSDHKCPRCAANEVADYVNLEEGQ